MTTVPLSTLLRRALLADAAASGGSGALLAFAAVPLAGLFGLPALLLQGAGLFTLAYGVLVAWLGTRERVWRPAVWAVIAGNGLWVLGSAELLFTSPSLTGWGQAYVIAQALAVAVLAELQFIGLRRAAPALQAA
ncbi:MAG: hypothetical protein AB1430_14470 [Pseudomonadota bacterium]